MNVQLFLAYEHTSQTSQTHTHTYICMYIPADGIEILASPSLWHYDFSPPCADERLNIFTCTIAGGAAQQQKQPGINAVITTATKFSITTATKTFISYEISNPLLCAAFLLVFFISMNFDCFSMFVCAFRW